MENSSPATPYMYCRECNTERPGEQCWKCGTTLKEVTHANWEPLRMPPLERIRELAMECGYACAVHGSQERDLDVVLVAWDEKALTRNYQEVMQYIADGLVANDKPARVVEIEVKPLGRHACTIQMNGWYKQIDLSMAPLIAPKMTEEHAREIVRAGRQHNLIGGFTGSTSYPLTEEDRQQGTPGWNAQGVIKLDGDFELPELMALVQLHPDNLAGAKVSWPDRPAPSVALSELTMKAEYVFDPNRDYATGRKHYFALNKPVAQESSQSTPSTMTDEQAEKILKDCIEHIGYVNDKPGWMQTVGGPLINLEGDFSREELLAVLQIHPGDKDAAG